MSLELELLCNPVYFLLFFSLLISDLILAGDTFWFQVRQVHDIGGHKCSCTGIGHQ